MKPSQYIPRTEIDDAYDKLHEEHERLKRSHDFDAKRLRVLARVAGCAEGVPDDATAVACAGTVLGMIRRSVEQIVAERDALRSAADPFVRATLMQEPFGLQDDMPVREWLPGAWPTMRDARRLVKAADAVKP